MDIFSGSFRTIERSLDYSSLKHEVTAQNIANADTPNYKGKQVSFKKLLSHSMNGVEARTTDPRHLKAGSGSSGDISLSDRNLRYTHDGNSVDIDKEMADLASNQIYYNTMAERMSSKFATLQNVIKGGR